MYVGLVHGTYAVWFCAESIWATVWDKHRTSEQTAVDVVPSFHNNYDCTTVLHSL
jgi:hypothetical protein